MGAQIYAPVALVLRQLLARMKYGVGLSQDSYDFQDGLVRILKLANEALVRAQGAGAW